MRAVTLGSTLEYVDAKSRDWAGMSAAERRPRNESTIDAGSAFEEEWLMGSDEGLEAWAVAATKAKYFRYTDIGRWDDLRALFTDDAEFELPFLGKFDHIDTAIQTVREKIGGEWSFHASSIPEISIISATEATGIFAMFSHAKKNDSEELGRMFGYYYDEFRKVEGKWLISSLRLISSYRNMFGFKHQATDLADTVL